MTLDVQFSDGRERLIRFDIPKMFVDNELNRIEKDGYELEEIGYKSWEDFQNPKACTMHYLARRKRRT